MFGTKKTLHSNIRPHRLLATHHKGWDIRQLFTKKAHAKGLLEVTTNATQPLLENRRYQIHPGRLTWNLQITHLERKMIFQTSMIMFHVNLQGCMSLAFCWVLFLCANFWLRFIFLWEFLVEVYFFVGILLRFIFGYNMIQLYYIQGVSICILSMTTDNKRNEPLKTDMKLENRLLQEEIPFDNQCFWRRLLCTYT